MTILKKITGICFIAASLLLALALIKATLDALLQIKNEIRISMWGGIFYALGCLVVIVLAALLTRYFWRTGFKLIKPKVIVIDPIDEIGL